MVTYSIGSYSISHANLSSCHPPRRLALAYFPTTRPRSCVFDAGEMSGSPTAVAGYEVIAPGRVVCWRVRRERSNDDGS